MSENRAKRWYPSRVLSSLGRRLVAIILGYGGVLAVLQFAGFPLSERVVRVALFVIVGVGVLHALAPWLRGLFRLRRSTPRAWARLATHRERDCTYIAAASALGHRCGVFRSSEHFKVRAAKREFARLLRKVRGRDVSLAMAPDGTRVAALASQKLAVMFVSVASSGCWHEWKSVTLPERQETLQILAVARRGEADAWLALAATHSRQPARTDMFLLALSDLERALAAVPDGPPAGLECLQPYQLRLADEGECAYGAANPYAAFLGTRLLFLDWEGRLRSVTTSPRGPAKVTLGGGHERLSEFQVLAVDSVRLPGRDYVALLAQDLGTDEGNIVLLAEWESAPTRWEKTTLGRPASHISLIRDPTGVVRTPTQDLAAVSVLCGSASSFEPVYMVTASEANEQRGGNVRSLKREARAVVPSGAEAV